MPSGSGNGIIWLIQNIETSCMYTGFEVLVQVNVWKIAKCICFSIDWIARWLQLGTFIIKSSPLHYTRKEPKSTYRHPEWDISPFPRCWWASVDAKYSHYQSPTGCLRNIRALRIPFEHVVEPGITWTKEKQQNLNPIPYWNHIHKIIHWRISQTKQ